MRIRLKQSTKFVDRKDLNKVQREIRLSASPETQNAPDWIQNDPMFGLLESDGKLEVVSSPAARPKLVAAAGTGLAGGAAADTDAKTYEPVDGKIDEAAKARFERDAADLEAQAQKDLAQAKFDSFMQETSGGHHATEEDWTTVGRDASGFPVPKGSPEDVTGEGKSS